MRSAIPVTIYVLICGGIGLFIVAAVYHHWMLKIEKGKIVRRGTPVEVDGRIMNVYIEGERSPMSIVMMSGSGAAAPLYEYKILYSKLTDEYRVAVVEKFGYGYSDISGLPRDVAAMVDEDRKALKNAGIQAPYVLMPHSMSALEAIYWAGKYPEEVEKIIGLDMAVPDSYQKSNMADITLKKFLTFFGMHRIPAFYRVHHEGLTDDEYGQNRILTYGRTLNSDVYAECRRVYTNAKIVGELGVPDVPILMFTTNLGRKAGYLSWVEAQDDFAKRTKDCVQIKLECGHDLQFYEADYIAMEIKKFLREKREEVQ